MRPVWLAAAIVLGFIASAFAADDGLYVVIEVDRGNAQVLRARRVSLATPIVAQPASMAGEWSAALFDRDHREVARQALNATSTVRVEYQDGTSIVHRSSDGPGITALRFPYRSGGRLEIRQLDRTVASYDLGTASEMANAGLTESVIGIGPSGDPRNRVDLLLLGDGYTAAEESKFFADVNTLAARFFEISPYREYSGYFNVKAVFVPSAQSGADHPNCPDPASLEDPKLGQKANTAFDATFCGNGAYRGLTVSDGKVYTAAAAYPEWDRIGVIVNDDTYGGSGGPVWVVSTHTLATEIAVHEFGHSFTGLTDEYSDAWTGATPCSDVTGTRRCEANATNETSRARLKWAAWVEGSTPVPTPPAFQSFVGLFQGARYSATSFYRPRMSCLMRLFRVNGEPVPFCEICREAFVRRLYETEQISLIEPDSPSPFSPIVVPPGTPVTLSASILRNGNDTVHAQWLVNGVAAPSATADRFTFTPPSPGAYTVTLQVTDTTPFVRRPGTTEAARSTHTWTVLAAVRRRTVRH